MADEAFISYGVGVFNNAENYIGEHKIINVGSRNYINNGLYWQNKVGGWSDVFPLEEVAVDLFLLD